MKKEQSFETENNWPLLKQTMEIYSENNIFYVLLYNFESVAIYNSRLTLIDQMDINCAAKKYKIILNKTVNNRVCLNAEIETPYNGRELVKLMMVTLI